MICITCKAKMTLQNSAPSTIKLGGNGRRCRKCNSLYCKSWRIEHKEQQAKDMKAWYQRNKISILLKAKQQPKYLSGPREWRSTHPERMRELKRRWNHSKKGKACKCRLQARRGRELPTSIVIGLPENDYELAHITPSIALWIPKEIHRNTIHSLRTGKNMGQHLREVLSYVSMNWKLFLNQEVYKPKNSTS